MIEIFNLNNILVHQPLTSQKEVFEKIAEVAMEADISDSKQAIVDGLFNRETHGTTGFLDGFAIPHTKSEAIHKPGAIIITLKDGIEWDSMDGKPVKFLIALLIPESEAGTTHLSLLSSISRMLIHQEIRDHLLAASKPKQILDQLNNALVSH
ncbi:PTS system fructose-specific IIA component [Bacillus pakistanensis]|uniref:PTS system fructose-specific IIA component n=1 Tax=Rossellomorea pakistanensis TaxID=992288 RepID=A0ABS2NHD1_9BACI|nr:fructose PTS transporter subunit IIA [Bacillus pakistanensis]MBM7587247.1 PTS system fructose-specific IIA component [Bacillus pakistanensis]